MLDKGAQAGMHSYEERGHDVYQTPVEAVRALLKCETLPNVIWEPAAGSGNIVRTLKTAGHSVLASDIRGWEDKEGFDFLVTDLQLSKRLVSRSGIQAIVTNPPFKLATRFIFRALDLVPLVAVLLRLGFYESDRRTTLLERSGLARIHVFRNRLPMMHREGWEGPKAASAIAFAWFVFDKNYTGPTTIDRISWESL